ncbi:unnamed protein product [Laminaria digitata]
MGCGIRLFEIIQLRCCCCRSCRCGRTDVVGPSLVTDMAGRGGLPKGGCIMRVALQQVEIETRPMPYALINHRCAKTAHRTERVSDCFRPPGMGWSDRTDRRHDGVSEVKALRPRQAYRRTAQRSLFAWGWSEYQLAPMGAARRARRGRQTCRWQCPPPADDADADAGAHAANGEVVDPSIFVDSPPL